MIDSLQKQTKKQKLKCSAEQQQVDKEMTLP